MGQPFWGNRSMGVLICLLFVFGSIPSSAMVSVEPDWSTTAELPPSGQRPNPYQWSPEELATRVRAGKLHAVSYPVEITGLLMPVRPALKILNAQPGSPLFHFLRPFLALDPDFTNFNGFWDWLGLHPYPEDNSIPRPDLSEFESVIGPNRRFPMGVTLISRSSAAAGITISCAGCHSGQLFGKTILGMSNRFPNLNEFFRLGKNTTQRIPTGALAAFTRANRGELQIYRETRNRARAVGIKKPEVLGLDTSLAQVALSLAHRSTDTWATRSEEFEKNPRATLLDQVIADSKPAVWWNVKYKTRWLSDGSIVSGNPIFTNFLWNEIGRGIDLPPLVEWLQKNKSIVEDLTTAVFATEAPKYRDFFGESRISIERARRGQIHYQQACAQCHGEYKKAWDLNPTEWNQEVIRQPHLSQLDTVTVRFQQKQTRVYNVNTDPGRYQGMQALADGLNPLEFSKRFDIRIEPQQGYVAPPLVGIWARFPYFHNNSIPNLCALMTPENQRPAIYFSGEPIDPERDFDHDCIGYPIGMKTPKEWIKNPNARFDSKRTGLSNQGHYDRIFLTREGQERFSESEKSELREFLKTL